MSVRVASGSVDIYMAFPAVDATDLVTPETGLTGFTVYRSRNGAAGVAWTTPTVVELDATNMPGMYALLLDEDTTIDAGHDEEELTIYITHASMDRVVRAVELFRPKVTAGQTLTAASGGTLLSAAGITALLATAYEGHLTVGSLGEALYALFKANLVDEWQPGKHYISTDLLDAGGTKFYIPVAVGWPEPSESARFAGRLVVLQRPGGIQEMARCSGVANDGVRDHFVLANLAGDPLAAIASGTQLFMPLRTDSTAEEVSAIVTPAVAEGAAEAAAGAATSTGRRLF